MSDSAQEKGLSTLEPSQAAPPILGAALPPEAKAAIAVEQLPKPITILPSSQNKESHNVSSSFPQRRKFNEANGPIEWIKEHRLLFLLLLLFFIGSIFILSLAGISSWSIVIAYETFPTTFIVGGCLLGSGALGIIIKGAFSLYCYLTSAQEGAVGTLNDVEVRAMDGREIGRETKEAKTSGEEAMLKQPTGKDQKEKVEEKDPRAMRKRELKEGITEDRARSQAIIACKFLYGFFSEDEELLAIKGTSELVKRLFIRINALVASHNAVVRRVIIPLEAKLTAYEDILEHTSVLYRPQSEYNVCEQYVNLVYERLVLLDAYNKKYPEGEVIKRAVDVFTHSDEGCGCFAHKKTVLSDSYRDGQIKREIFEKESKDPEAAKAKKFPINIYLEVPSPYLLDNIHGLARELREEKKQKEIAKSKSIELFGMYCGVLNIDEKMLTGSGIASSRGFAKIFHPDKHMATPDYAVELKAEEKYAKVNGIDGLRYALSDFFQSGKTKVAEGEQKAGTGVQKGIVGPFCCAVFAMGQSCLGGIRELTKQGLSKEVFADPAFIKGKARVPQLLQELYAMDQASKKGCIVVEDMVFVVANKYIEAHGHEYEYVSKQYWISRFEQELSDVFSQSVLAKFNVALKDVGFDITASLFLIGDRDNAELQTALNEYLKEQEKYIKELDEQSKRDREAKAQADEVAKQEKKAREEADARTKEADAKAKQEREAREQADARAKQEREAREQADARAKQEKEAREQADARAKEAEQKYAELLLKFSQSQAAAPPGTQFSFQPGLIPGSTLQPQAMSAAVVGATAAVTVTAPAVLKVAIAEDPAILSPGSSISAGEGQKNEKQLSYR